MPVPAGNCSYGRYISGRAGAVRPRWWTSPTTPTTVRQIESASPPPSSTRRPTGSCPGQTCSGERPVHDHDARTADPVGVGEVASLQQRNAHGAEVPRCSPPANRPDANRWEAAARRPGPRARTTSHRSRACRSWAAPAPQRPTARRARAPADRAARDRSPVGRALVWNRTGGELDPRGEQPLAGRKPGSTCRRWRKLWTRRPAPVTSTSARATCPATSRRRTR